MPDRPYPHLRAAAVHHVGSRAACVHPANPIPDACRPPSTGSSRRRRPTTTARATRNGKPPTGPGYDVDVVLMNRVTAEAWRHSTTRIQGAALQDGRTVNARRGIEPIVNALPAGDVLCQPQVPD